MKTYRFSRRSIPVLLALNFSWERMRSR